jgi:hypothetical protein
METPVGNPNVSLLPQPATPAPIEPMRGGSMTTGGGSENVSLLPQPAVPAPIEPMRGGSMTENTSLLPQPAVPVPIEPMKGGGLSPIVYLREMRLPDLGLKTAENTNIFLEASRVQLHKRDMIKYNVLRKDITWKGTTLPTKTENTRNIELPYTIPMDIHTVLYIFPVKDFKNYLQIERKIVTILEQIEKKTSSDEVPVFIIQDITKDATSFSEIYRSFLKFVVATEEIISGGKKYTVNNSEYNIFFLFDKSASYNNIAWNLSTERDAKSAFYYLEPDYIIIKFPSGGKDKSFILFPGRKSPTTFKTDFISLGTSPDIANKIDITGEGRTKKSAIIRELGENKAYTIDTKRKEDFWNNHYLSIKFSDIEDEEEDEEESINTRSLFNDEEREEPVANSANTTSAKALRTFQLKGFKDTITVDLGGRDYEIRKSTPTVEAEWKAGTFSKDETALFDTIGINADFIASKEAEKQTLVAKRAEFLRTLVLKNCLSDANYLLSTECDFMRDYLQDLLVIRQKDRLRAATSFIASIDDFNVDIKEVQSAVAQINDIVGIESVIKSLLGAVRIKLRSKLPVPFNKVLDKVSVAASTSSKPAPAMVTGSVGPYAFTATTKTKQKTSIMPSVFTKLFTGLTSP